MVYNAPSVGIVRCSKNPVDARKKNIQQRAKSLSLAGALKAYQTWPQKFARLSASALRPSIARALAFLPSVSFLRFQAASLPFLPHSPPVRARPSFPLSLSPTHISPTLTFMVMTSNERTKGRTNASAEQRRTTWRHFRRRTMGIVVQTTERKGKREGRKEGRKEGRSLASS